MEPRMLKMPTKRQSAKPATVLTARSDPRSAFMAVFDPYARASWSRDAWVL